MPYMLDEMLICQKCRLLPSIWMLIISVRKAGVLESVATLVVRHLACVRWYLL
jgi:hypothetical protein